MYCFQIDWWISTVFHPQTNGKNEKQNRVLKKYLWSYVNHHQDDWAPLFALAKFAYNKTIHFLTGKVPFKIVYREVSRLEMITLNEV